MGEQHPVVSAIGAAFDPAAPGFQDAHALYARARREEPIFFAPALGAWVVTRHDDVREVLGQPDVFSSANSLRTMVDIAPSALAEMRRGFPPGQGVLNADGDAHRRYRAPVARRLSPERVDAFEPFIRQQAGALVDAFAADGRADLVAQYALPLPPQVIARVLGLDDVHIESAVWWSRQTNFLLFTSMPEEEQVAAARDYVAFQRLLDGYVDRRRARPRDDLMSDVVAALAPGAGPLTFEQRAELIWNLVGIFVAGHVTTTALLGNGLLHLLADRPQWELLCRRPELIRGAATEMARYDSPVHGFLRLTTRQVRLAGVEMEPGTEVLALFASANRDESHLDGADHFDITREPRRHLAFGFGVHLCAGIHLAQREVEVALETLTTRLPSLRLEPGPTPPVNPGLTHRGVRSLHVTWSA